MSEVPLQPHPLPPSNETPRGACFVRHALCILLTAPKQPCPYDAIASLDENSQELWQGPGCEEIGISLPNNHRQHRTVHIQKHLLPYALC